MKAFLIIVLVGLFIASKVEAQLIDVNCVNVNTCKEPCKQRHCRLPSKCMNGKCMCSLNSPNICNRG
uniref:CSab-Iso-8 n=1 Tax=Isometroides vescus TaxID=1330405 RepID=T1DMS1_9SCOR